MSLVQILREIIAHKPRNIFNYQIILYLFFKRDLKHFLERNMFIIQKYFVAVVVKDTEYRGKIKWGQNNQVK